MAGIVLSGSLRTPELGLRLTATFEGCKLRAYYCPAKKLTIGLGHTNDAGGFQFDETTVLSGTAQALEIFADDIDRFEGGVERLLGPELLEELTPYQFAALVDLAFNIGLGAFAKSTLLKKIRKRDFDAVPAQFMRWNKVDGQALEGLTRRRRANCALWRGDLDEAERACSAKYGPMPQRVDAPRPPKSIVRSREAQASTGVGVGGAVETAVEGAKVIARVNAEIERAAESAQALGVAEILAAVIKAALAHPGLCIGLVLIVLAIVIIACRYGRLHEDHA